MCWNTKSMLPSSYSRETRSSVETSGIFSQQARVHETNDTSNVTFVLTQCRSAAEKTKTTNDQKQRVKIMTKQTVGSAAKLSILFLVVLCTFCCLNGNYSHGKFESLFPSVTLTGSCFTLCQNKVHWPALSALIFPASQKDQSIACRNYWLMITAVCTINSANWLQASKLGAYNR